MKSIDFEDTHAVLQVFRHCEREDRDLDLGWAEQLGKYLHFDVSAKELYLTLLNDRSYWSKPGEAWYLVLSAIVMRTANTICFDFEFAGFPQQFYECGGYRHRIATFRHKQSGMLLKLIPGGQFLMGSRDDDSNAFNDEFPQHEQTIQAFLIGQYPVLEAQWTAVGGSRIVDSLGPNHPASDMDLQGLNHWFAASQGGLRLCTEAEWEFSCRAGTQSQYYWGNSLNDDFCWSLRNSRNQCQDVRLHDDHCNAFGLVDMLGNVWELCSDKWRWDYNSGGKTAANAQTRRGGGWNSLPRYVRSASRHICDSFEDSGETATGFRVARSLDL